MWFSPRQVPEQYNNLLNQISSTTKGSQPTGVTACKQLELASNLILSKTTKIYMQKLNKSPAITTEYCSQDKSIASSVNTNTNVVNSYKKNITSMPTHSTIKINYGARTPAFNQGQSSQKTTTSMENYGSTKAILDGQANSSASSTMTIGTECCSQDITKSIANSVNRKIKLVRKLSTNVVNSNKINITSIPTDSKIKIKIKAHDGARTPAYLKVKSSQKTTTSMENYGSTKTILDGQRARSSASSNVNSMKTGFSANPTTGACFSQNTIKSSQFKAKVDGKAFTNTTCATQTVNSCKNTLISMITDCSVKTEVCDDYATRISATETVNSSQNTSIPVSTETKADKHVTRTSSTNTTSVNSSKNTTTAIKSDCSTTTKFTTKTTATIKVNPSHTTSPKNQLTSCPSKHLSESSLKTTNTVTQTLKYKAKSPVKRHKERIVKKSPKSKVKTIIHQT